MSWAPEPVQVTLARDQWIELLQVLHRATAEGGALATTCETASTAIAEAAARAAMPKGTTE